MRQHAAMLRRKTREVLEELDQDKKFLDKLIEQEQADLSIQSARREQARADAEWMKQVGLVDGNYGDSIAPCWIFGKVICFVHVSLQLSIYRYEFGAKCLQFRWPWSQFNQGWI